MLELEPVRPWLEGERAHAGAHPQGTSSTLPRVGLHLLFGVGQAADEDTGCSGQEESQLWTLYVRGSRSDPLPAKAFPKGKETWGPRRYAYLRPMAPFVYHTLGT